MGDITIKDDNSRYGKPIMLFGTDLREIRCFRSSVIFGICTGVVGGLAAFMFTSKPAMSSHIAFATMWVGTFGYWIPCRYKYETGLLQLEAYKQKIQDQRVAPSIKADSNDSDK